MIKRLKQKFKTREQIKREIKKDVIVYAQSKWPITFSRVFEIQVLSGPLIDEMPNASISIGKDKIRFLIMETMSLLSELNYSEITDIICDQFVFSNDRIACFSSSLCFSSDSVMNYFHYTLQTVYGDYTFTMPSERILIENFI